MTLLFSLFKYCTSFIAGIPGRVKTLAELEADLNKPKQLPARCFSPNQAPPSMPQAQHPNNLERMQHMHNAHNIPPHMTMPVTRQRPPTPPQKQVTPQGTRRSSQEEGDMTAFNKLLTMMQAGAAAAVETPPKMVVR